MRVVVYEVDHVFVWVDVGAPAADQLVSFGLTEGDPNVHPGQGTANRRFFFPGDGRSFYGGLSWRWP